MWQLKAKGKKGRERFNMDNLFMGKEKVSQPDAPKRIDTKMIPPGTIRPRHLQAGLFAIQVGLAADRPTSGGETKFYFATDTNTFSAWNGSVWKSSILT